MATKKTAPYYDINKGMMVNPDGTAAPVVKAGTPAGYRYDPTSMMMVPGEDVASSVWDDVTLASKARTAGLSEDIRIILALKELDSDLNDAWTAFQEGRIDDMYAAIYKSKFYKDNTQVARNRQAAKERQPGAYATELDAWKINTRKRLTNAGVKVTPEVEAQLEQAYLLGMNEDQVDAVLSKKGLVGTLGGQTGGAVNQLKSYARSMGVDSYYNSAWWNERSKGLFDGTTTPEDIQAEIRTLSASMFPSFADDINAGRSLEASASYITQILSNRTGRQLSTSSPEVQRFMQWTNPKTGKQERPPGWIVDQEGWKLPGADRTPEAVAKADNIGLRVLQDMGLM